MSKECDQFVHGCEIGGVVNEAALPLAANQADAGEMCEVKRQRWRRDAELLADRAGIYSLRARFDEHPEDGKPRFVAQRGEAFSGIQMFHGSNIIK